MTTKQQVNLEDLMREYCEEEDKYANTDWYEYPENRIKWEKALASQMTIIRFISYEGYYWDATTREIKKKG